MLEVEYVEKSALPRGHAWMLIEEGSVVRAVVIDGAAERVVRAVYSNSRNCPSESNASAIRESSADW